MCLLKKHENTSLHWLILVHMPINRYVNIFVHFIHHRIPIIQKIPGGLSLNTIVRNGSLICRLWLAQLGSSSPIGRLWFKSPPPPFFWDTREWVPKFRSSQFPRFPSFRNFKFPSSRNFNLKLLNCSIMINYVIWTNYVIWNAGISNDIIGLNYIIKQNWTVEWLIRFLAKQPPPPPSEPLYII